MLEKNSLEKKNCSSVSLTDVWKRTDRKIYTSVKQNLFSFTLFMLYSKMNHYHKHRNSDASQKSDKT